ncbi:histidine kinase [Tolypothrix sp. VBCCA 56010]|uniref:histidine kinase n=1 Tax=Tolypothrix sp. VBCCA 56010 TaxID=3137731 RepID=UPI003D7ED5ED
MGIGHWAMGFFNLGQRGKGKGERERIITNAPCPMPIAPCPMPHAQCPIPN